MVTPDQFLCWLWIENYNFVAIQENDIIILKANCLAKVKNIFYFCLNKQRKLVKSWVFFVKHRLLQKTHGVSCCLRYKKWKQNFDQKYLGSNESVAMSYIKTYANKVDSEKAAEGGGGGWS